MARGGYIKLHRALLDSWFQELKPEYYKLAITILLRTNWEDSVAPDGTLVKRGQSLTSLKGLEKACPGLSRDQIRRGLTALQTATLITTQTTRKHTLITVVNWKTYQPTAEETATETATETAPQTATIKEVKDSKEVTPDVDGFATDKPSRKKKPPTPEALRLANGLHKCIVGRDPGHRLATSFTAAKRDTWARTIDLMLGKDKRSFDDVHRGITWLFSFDGNLSRGKYRLRIESAAALREKFDKVRAAMAETQTAVPSGTVSSNRPRKLKPSEIDALRRAESEQA